MQGYEHLQLTSSYGLNSNRPLVQMMVVAYLAGITAEESQGWWKRDIGKSPCVALLFRFLWYGKAITELSHSEKKRKRDKQLLVK